MKNPLDIENILKNIDGESLTDVLEPYAEEFSDEIIASTHF